MEGLYKFGRAQNSSDCCNGSPVLQFEVANGVALLKLFTSSLVPGAFVFPVKAR
jgi:hypothetical protein